MLVPMVMNFVVSSQVAAFDTRILRLLVLDKYRRLTRIIKYSDIERKWQCYVAQLCLALILYLLIEFAWLGKYFSGDLEISMFFIFIKT